ncbi:sugar kinase [Salinarimonas ramus]|uniref:2-dehydro-3-deoxygluconokinase n=1 Tax=Salinarimonas ramus TaxID=690164 RepID=A0A917QCJ6_9HYPH|nr:sugar kinase [Salinarimonas ramus]GGK44015.1 2-dehydro-3-deoxygluconokinase [Salinarimonas ramus]
MTEKTIDILSIGEPLMELAETGTAEGRLYAPGFGGDCSNVAIAAARQGARAAMATAVGDDTFGQAFLDLWEKEGVDTSAVIRRAGERTGVYFISYGPDGHDFSYYRQGSAASLVSVAELPREAIARARIVHASGISQAISPSCTDAVFAAMRTAREAGALVSYDTNLRLRLWPLDRARAIIQAAAGMADIVLPGLDDARQLTGLDRPEEICADYLRLGARVVALTLGKDGAMIATGEGAPTVIPARRVDAIDATGAGDAFDGAFLAEYLRHGDALRAGAYANAAAALSTTGIGAVAPLPTRERVEAFLADR